MSQDLLVLGEPSRAGVRDRVLLLRSVPSFQGLDEEGMTLLAEHAKNCTYRPGDVIVREGQVATSLHIVLDGRVAVTRNDTTNTVLAGRTFGMLGVIAGAPTALVVAMEPTRTLEIPAAAFQVALDENFSLVRNLLRVMGSALLKTRRSLPADPDHPPDPALGTYYDTPRSLVERVLDLRDSPFGQSGIPMGALVELARRMTEVRVGPGHVFWSAGDPSTYSLHIAYGRARCTAPNGQFVDVGADYSLGVLDVWGSQPRAYECRSETEIIAYVVAFEDFLTILEAHLRLAMDLLGGFGSSLLETAESL